MPRIEQRGARRLRTVQVDRLVFDRLRQFAVATNKPLRWHVEQAVSAQLGIASPSYHLSRIARIASGIVATADPENLSLANLVEALFVRCDKLSIARPHVQTARKHLRAAMKVLPEFSSKLKVRQSRAFTPDEDSVLLRERAAGLSLSQIGIEVSRRPNVVLRRLRHLGANVT